MALSLLTNTKLFSTHVAKEVSSLFSLGKDEAYPILDSLLSSGDDELFEKLKNYGIDLTDYEETVKQEEIELLDEIEDEEEESKKAKGENVFRFPQRLVL